MELAAVVISVFALVVSSSTALRQLELARHSNSMPVLIELFREHRGSALADARTYVFREIAHADLSQGLESLPEASRNDVRNLLWFYDNLGALVVHGIIDVGPVSGYLGGTALMVWDRLEPLVRAERQKRRDGGVPDPERWQEYFELLVGEFRRNPPSEARRRSRLMRFRA